MSTVLDRPNKTPWMIGCGIPYIGGLVMLALWGSVFKYIRALNPETELTETKAVIWTVCTCGLYLMILPYILMKETAESAALVGIEVQNYAGHYYGLVFGGVFASMIVGGIVGAILGAMGVSMDAIFAISTVIGLVIGGLSNAFAAGYFLKPFEQIADAYNS